MYNTLKTNIKKTKITIIKNELNDKVDWDKKQLFKYKEKSGIILSFGKEYYSEHHFFGICLKGDIGIYIDLGVQFAKGGFELFNDKVILNNE